MKTSNKLKSNKFMSMKWNKWVLYINAALLPVFSACSADAPMEMVQDDGRVEIRVSTGISSAVSPATRAVPDGMINSGFGTDLDVAFARADAGDNDSYTAYETKALTGSITASNKTLSFSEPVQYYLANGKNTKLIGWYPRRSGVTFTQTTGEVNFGDIDGKTDIMVTPLQEGNKNTKMPEFRFKHLLTQISVKVYAPDAAAAGLWGKVLSPIKITGMKQSCKFTVPAVTSVAGTEIAAPTFTGTADLDLAAAQPTAPTTAITYPLSLGVGTADNAVVAGYAMFAPKSTGSIELQINMETGGSQKATISVPASKGFEAGTAYAITLKFTSVGITPNVSVVDWVDGTPIGDIEI